VDEPRALIGPSVHVCRALVGGVYQLPAGSRQLREVLDYKVRVSNATCFTPDGRIMFFCDSPTRRVYAFDYDPRQVGYV